MRILVVYESKTGATEQYAQWLAEELGTQSLALESCSIAQLQNCDLIVFGGSVHGGIINGKKKLFRLAEKAGCREVVCFAVGIRPVTQRTLGLIRRSNFGSAEDGRLFYFRGRFHEGGLDQRNRTMVRIYRSMLKRRRMLHPEDKEMLEAMGCSCDFTSREQIMPLVHTIKQRVRYC
ncbi:MAG: hypothetical protein IKB65_07925 [Ruminiclostridium sp.]|nr:hypothetical protein [Ruminiclostridium sp.]